MYFQVVGESGLFNPDDVAYVQNAGVSAVSSSDCSWIDKIFSCVILKTHFSLWMYISFGPEKIYATS
jgi:hypothetical protein